MNLIIKNGRGILIELWIKILIIILLYRLAFVYIVRAQNQQHNENVNNNNISTTTMRTWQIKWEKNTGEYINANIDSQTKGSQLPFRALRCLSSGLLRCFFIQ